MVVATSKPPRKTVKLVVLCPASLVAQFDAVIGQEEMRSRAKSVRDLMRAHIRQERIAQGQSGRAA